MWHPIKHYKTIRHHKMLVMKNCFRCGLYWQGLTHDLSKLAPVEFWAGAKYWQGTCSPNNAQRQAEGYSAAWLHHKGRNKHHLEYWIDYAPDGDHAMAGMRIGFAIANEKLIGYLKDVKFSYNSYTMNLPAIELGVEAVKDREYFEKEMLKNYYNQVALAVDYAKKVFGPEIPPY